MQNHLRHSQDKTTQRYDKLQNNNKKCTSFDVYLVVTSLQPTAQAPPPDTPLLSESHVAAVLQTHRRIKLISALPHRLRRRDAAHRTPENRRDVGGRREPAGSGGVGAGGTGEGGHVRVDPAVRGSLRSAGAGSGRVHRRAKNSSQNGGLDPRSLDLDIDIDIEAQHWSAGGPRPLSPTGDFR